MNVKSSIRKILKSKKPLFSAAPHGMGKSAIVLEAAAQNGTEVINLKLSRRPRKKAILGLPSRVVEMNRRAHLEALMKMPGSVKQATEGGFTRSFR